MSNGKETTTPVPQSKGKESAVPILRGILKSAQNAPSSPNLTRHVSFSWKASTIVSIPYKNRGRRPSHGMVSKKKRPYYDSQDWVIVNNPRIERGTYIIQDDTWDDWVIVPRPDEEDTASESGGEIISCQEMMALSDEERADSILSEPFEHMRIRLQRHLQRDS